MRMNMKRAKPLCVFLLMIFINAFVFPFSAAAEMISTESVLAGEATTDSEREKVRAYLDREDVQTQLRDYGVNPEEAIARVDALTDEEVAAIAHKLDQVPAGGTDGLSVIVGLALFGAIIVLAGVVLFFKWLLFDDKSALLTPESTEYATADTEEELFY